MNYGTQEGRNRIRAERTDELAAIADGTWPRNLDDGMRWSSHGQALAHWAKKMCEADIAYIENLETRIARGEKPWG